VGPADNSRQLAQIADAMLTVNRIPRGPDGWRVEVDPTWGCVTLAIGYASGRPLWTGPAVAVEIARILADLQGVSSHSGGAA
jgi:hypothetical protein